MKKLMLCAGVAMLSACSQGGGSANVATCNADPFDAYGKVLVAGTNDVASRRSYDRLEVEDIAALSNPAQANYLSVVKTSSTIPSGTELTVTLKEGCSSGGSITRQVREVHPQEESRTGAGVRSFTWTPSRETTSKELEDWAKGDECVVGLSDSQQSFAAEGAGDPLLVQQGHLKMLDYSYASEAIRAVGVVDQPVTIAVVDTGIDMNHEDLKPNLWRNEKEIPANGIDDDKNGYVDDVYGYDFATGTGSPQHKGSWSGSQHGTHVSGLAAARSNNGLGVSGVMGNAKIMMLNVFGSNSGAASSAVANAIRYAADNGADVINLSIGGSGRSATYESALRYAINKGVVIVAAAGNERREVGPDYFLAPGAYAPLFSGMLSVASVDSRNGALSTFSNYSSAYVEIGAPGSEQSANRVGVLSTWPGNKYARLQGTSMASPVVAGGAALAISMLKARGYERNPAMIEHILGESAKTSNVLQDKIRGGRVMNLKTLVQLIETRFPPGGKASGFPVEQSSSCSTGANL